ncbi:MAG: YbaN family protein [Lachnotalea sp.]
MKKKLLFLSGWLLLGIATLGIFLPILPTTPLVILAASCFSVADPKLYKRLESNRIFGPYIEGWRTKQGITLARKAIAIVIVWVLLLISIFVTQKLWLKILLTFVGIGVTVHLLLFKTRVTENKLEKF